LPIEPLRRANLPLTIADELRSARRILFDTMSRNHEFVLGLYALNAPVVVR
jgi:hypothetical protein